MFVTMATDSARNLVCRALGSSRAAMWCQFGPRGAFLSLCLSPPARISLSFLSLSFLSLSLGLSIFLLPGNNCLCFPACCRWRQPSLNSSWHPWLRMSQKGWEHGKCRSLALGSGRAQPGSGLFDRLAPCLLKAPGKEGRRLWETLVRRMWAFSFKHRFKLKKQLMKQLFFLFLSFFLKTFMFWPCCIACGVLVL